MGNIDSTVIQLLFFLFLFGLAVVPVSIVLLALRISIKFGRKTIITVYLTQLIITVVGIFVFMNFLTNNLGTGKGGDPVNAVALMFAGFVMFILVFGQFIILSKIPSILSAVPTQISKVVQSEKT